jgi:hypothetical protein
MAPLYRRRPGSGAGATLIPQRRHTSLVPPIGLTRSLNSNLASPPSVHRAGYPDSRGLHN